jgi:hypothetical protein
MVNFLDRFRQLAGTRKGMRLFALVDGFQYHQHKEQCIEYEPKVNRALFQGTDDEALGHAGPWLFDVTENPLLFNELSELEQAIPSVSWLMTPLELEGLAQVLQLKLHAKLPDGREALVRFYDPRVLGNLFNIMSAEQRTEFAQLVDEWHFIYNGQRAWIGRENA